MNVFEAFNDRLQRRLREFESEAQHDSMAIRAQSGARIRAQLDAITARLHRGIDWAFTEAAKLPGQASMTRLISAPYLTKHLDQHIGALYANVHLAGLGTPVEKAVNDHRTQSKEMLKGELKDFSEGIWHPRNAPKDITETTTNNTVNIQGSHHGPVQQAGANSNQQATFAINSDHVAAALRQFTDALAASAIDPTIKGEMQAEASTIEIQLKRPKPNISVVQAAARGIEELAIQVGSNILTPYVVALLAMIGVR
jgi:hypothetical protein